MGDGFTVLCSGGGGAAGGSGDPGSRHLVGGLAANPFRMRDMALGAKRKGIRLIVTLECTEARGLVAQPPPMCVG